MGWFYRSTEPDPETGILEDVYLGNGPDEGKFHLVRRQNIDEELSIAQHSRAAAPGSFYRDDGLYKSASIPMVEIERWKAEFGFDWFQSNSIEKKAWLNRPMNAKWKLRDVTI